MLRARYDHRLLLLVLPAALPFSLSLSLSLSLSSDDRFAIQREDLSRSTEHVRTVLYVSDKNP